MTRGGLIFTLLGLLASPTWGAAATVAKGGVAVPVPKPRDERIVPLGPAEVTELLGGASLLRGSSTGPGGQQVLSRGMTVSGEVRIQTAATPAGRAELRFSDGSLLRLDGGTAISLLPALRQVVLHAGRILVVADRMVGGVTVLTAGRAFVPEGTTYFVEAATEGAGSAIAEKTRLTVLEGAVCACMVAASPPAASKPGQAAPRPAPGAVREQMILPGETWSSLVKPGGPASSPVVIDLTALLRGEPLVSAFSAPLPSLAKVAELADQQRRRLLAGRNARLRREIFWKRQPRAPLRLPALLADPNSVTVTYE